MRRRGLALLAILASGCFSARDGGTGARDGASSVDGAVGADAAHILGGEGCDDAPLIAPGDYLGDTSGMTDDLQAGDEATCGASGSYGADAVFRIAVPAQSRLTAGVMPSPALDTVLMLVTALQCTSGPSACLAGNDTGNPGVLDAASWVNDGADTEVRVIVDGYEGRSEGAFALHLGVAPAARGESCETAFALPEEDAVVGFQTTKGFEDDPISCSGPGHDLGGADVYYKLEVAAGRAYDVAIAPSTSVDVRLVVIDPLEGGVCAALATCSNAIDSEGPGGLEVASIPADAAPRVVYVGVEHGTDQGHGGFTVQVDAR